MAHYGLNIAHPHTAHATIIRLVGSAKRILEVGCSAGYLSEMFTHTGCTVTAIELDQAEAEKARPYCSRIIIGSIEDPNILQAAAGTYDVIVCADVLEHLRSPLSVLERLGSYLHEDGCFIVSLPNVANWKVRISLLLGRFEYADEGILDRTHLRFFTIASARQLLERAGCQIDQFHPAATRMPLFLVRSFPSLFAVHLIFRARKRSR